ncbi:hypothetical protein [Pusillimonas sp.]|uniref:hypothetical protein n=1 Tax=Pusillimonas sp. TaxID=3040095 RepID=UPI0037C5352F
MSDLQKYVDQIAHDLTKGMEDDDGNSIDAFAYLGDVLDIEYVVNKNGEYLGARILVAYGGPNIWINTRTGTVEGYWWSDRATATYKDSMGLDDALSELWACR